MALTIGVFSLIFILTLVALVLFCLRLLVLIERWLALLGKDIKDLSTNLSDSVEKIQDYIEKTVTSTMEKQRYELENSFRGFLTSMKTTQKQVIKETKTACKSALIKSVGKADPKKKEDLTKIKGVGKKIQRKLNLLGIYTFKQVSKMTERDKKRVDQLIGFFPGRVKRERWMQQAKALKK